MRADLLAYLKRIENCMRAYLAVIKDSFREAFASRVLWILLVLITLLLLALAPLGVREQAASELRRSDVISGADFAKELFDQSSLQNASPAKHIWNLLSDDLQQRVAGLESDEEARDAAPVLRKLVDELNDSFGISDFYNETAWSEHSVGDEAGRLFERGLSGLSEVELRRFNRLALDAAFADHIAAAPLSSMQVVYLTFEIADPLSMDRTGLNQIVNTVMVAVMTFLVGIIGVFVAILVTASIIPQTFDSGSISLLLSRPLSRSLLFLTKFLGGCAFILLNSAYLIVGFWLIVGIRFDVWNSKLLLCIPVFLFLFAIYYCVSALAGVVWKNAVVCVVMAILFWTACFTVGTTKAVIENVFLDPERISRIIPAGETLLVTNESGETLVWEGEWRQVFETEKRERGPFGMVSPIIGPVFDSEHDQLAGIETSTRGFGGFGGAGTLVIGRLENDWKRVGVAAAPRGAAAIFVDKQGRVLIAGTSGIYTFDDLTAEPAENAAQFVDVGPEQARRWQSPFAVDKHPTSDSLAIFSRGVLNVLNPTAENQYAIERQIDLDTNEPAIVGFAGRRVMVALGSGEIRVFDAESLEQVAAYEPFDNEKPRAIATSSDGRWFAALYHNRKLSLFDTQSGQPIDPDIDPQGVVSAATFKSDGTLLLADRRPRVIEYDVETWSTISSIEPESEVLELVYRYAVLPIYTVFPKPSELDNMVSYLLTDQETATVGGQEQNLQAQRIVLNIWEPVWSNLAFLAVVLCLTCIYVERKDF